MKTSEHLQIGNLYSRVELAQLFGITDATIRTGVFRPGGHDSIWLFVTEQKTEESPYRDLLEGNNLSWSGQLAGRTDRAITDHKVNGLELLVFYRQSKSQYENSAFRYEGPFEYVNHSGSNPTQFMLRRMQTASSQQGTSVPIGKS